MTEKKRLVDLVEECIEDQFLIDTSNDKYYWVSDSVDDIVKLLNELKDKCEFLEIENESLEDGATKYAELYHKSLKENEQLKQDLINHSALISMLEDYQALKIEETLWNLTDAKSEEEFNELYKPYLDEAKKCWR